MVSLDSSVGAVPSRALVAACDERAGEGDDGGEHAGHPEGI